MKLKYTYTLFTLIMVLYFVPADAQKNNKTKKAVTKTVKKQPAKAPAKPAAKPATVKKQTDAKTLGEAAAKVSSKDTVGNRLFSLIIFLRVSRNKV